MRAALNTNGPQRGVALILVLFVVALASILVIDLTYSTSLGSRQMVQIQHSTQAEYLLKSALNLARVLLRDDANDEDSARDNWGIFLGGIPIPAELFSSGLPNVVISLEIRPEEAKIPIAALVPPGFSAPNQTWRDVLIRLFQSLGFDDDQEERDQSGLFPNRHFDSTELVGILIDYMDRDEESYQPGGIESEIPKGRFSNSSVQRIGELAQIPGFTPRRLQKLIPYLTALGSVGGSPLTINVNVAPRRVLQSLHPAFDPAMVDQMIAFRDSDRGPFAQTNFIAQLTEIVGDPGVVSSIQSIVRVQSKWFQVIAKVQYDSSTYFLRAYLYKENPRELPVVQSMELF